MLYTVQYIKDTSVIKTYFMLMGRRGFKKYDDSY